MVRSRSRVLLLGAGALVAAVTVWTAPDDAPVTKMEIRGTPLTAGGGSLVAGVVTPPIETEETDPPAPPLVLPDELVGDAALAGAFTADAFERVGDHYEAPLADGRRLKLTLDPAYQEAAAAILRESRAPRGAIVVLDADGSVLALAGRRAADPGGSVEGTPDATLATEVWAPAASIFKIVTAAALVDAGVKPETRVCFHGGVRSVMESNLTDNKADRRCETLTYGVAHSQNAIIAKLVHQKLDPSALAEAAVALGVDGDTAPWAFAGRAGEVDVPTEKGVELGKTAAGFTNSSMSPIGAALLASAVGNHGKVAPPRIVAAVLDGEKTLEVTPIAPKQAISAKTADAVATMMASTCASGSAAKSFRQWKGARVAGKTGTLGVDKPIYTEYSWFVGFIETTHGSVAIAVVLGNAEDWWMKAHTAARRVLDRALKPKA
jgi:penicillin-binding protein A